MHNFRSVESRSRISNLDHGVLMKSWFLSRCLKPGLGLEGYGLDYITGFYSKNIHYDSPVHA